MPVIRPNAWPSRQGTGDPRSVPAACGAGPTPNVHVSHDLADRLLTEMDQLTTGLHALAGE
jgi:hypothetical protein